MTLYFSLFACFDCAIHLVFVFMRIKPRSLHNNLCNMYNNYENGQIEPDLKWFLKRINLINKDHHLAIVRNYQTDPVGNYKFIIYLSHILIELGTQHFMITTQIGNYYQFKRLLLFFFPIIFILFFTHFVNLLKRKLLQTSIRLPFWCYLFFSFAWHFNDVQFNGQSWKHSQVSTLICKNP